MSQEENTLTVGNGPMTVRRSLNNILAALNIAQAKGAFSIRESAFVFTSLQKINEFVNKYESQENDVSANPPLSIEPVQEQKNTQLRTPSSQPVSKTPVQVKQPVQKKPVQKSIPKKIPTNIDLENDEVNEIIEI